MSAAPRDPADATGPGGIAVAAAAIGGMVGTGLRLGLGEALSPATAVLVANLLGAFALGLLFSALHRRRRGGSAMWTLLGPGLLGAFTTFSALQLEVVEQLRDGYPLHAAGYLAVSVGLGVPLAAGGRWVGRRLA